MHLFATLGFLLARRFADGLEPLGWFFDLQWLRGGLLLLVLWFNLGGYFVGNCCLTACLLVFDCCWGFVVWCLGVVGLIGYLAACWWYCLLVTFGVTFWFCFCLFGLFVLLFCLLVVSLYLAVSRRLVVWFVCLRSLCFEWFCLLVFV